MQLITKIDNPCNQNWDSMTPVEGGKYCGSCQKTVVDFSGMNQEQILDYLSTKGDISGGICIQAASHQLNIPTTPAIPKRMPRLAAASLVAMLAISAPKARAQQIFTLPTYENLAGHIFRDTAIDNKLAFGAKSDSILIVIDGEIFDGDIEEIDRSTVDSFEWVLNPMGGFCAGNRDVLIITTRKVKTLATVEVVARCEKYYRGTAGFFYHIRRPWKLPLFDRKREPDEIKAYPNPINRGEELSIKIDIDTPGNMVITNMHGQVMFVKKALSAQGVVKFGIPGHWSSGKYIFSFIQASGPVKTTTVIIK